MMMLSQEKRIRIVKKLWLQLPYSVFTVEEVGYYLGPFCSDTSSGVSTLYNRGFQCLGLIISDEGKS